MSFVSHKVILLLRYNVLSVWLCSFAAMPPVSQRPHPLSVLIIYAKDSILQNPQALPAPYQRSPEDYCGEVEQLVDTLSVFSGVQAQDGTTIASFRCAYDGGSGFIPNWLQWFDEELKNADCVLLLCSPQLIASLSQPTGSVQMARGQCNVASLNFYITQKCFIPVFLNMPRQSEWIPVSLRAADCYELYIGSLHHQMGDTSSMDERQFVEAAYRCLATPHLQPLNQLLRVLRREVPASRSSPIRRFRPGELLYNLLNLQSRKSYKLWFFTFTINECACVGVCACTY